MASQTITASVGAGGVNRPEDVRVVQGLLRARGTDPGPADGICGKRTVGAIRAFQRGFLPNPDGLVEPGRATWRRLAGEVVAVSAAWAGDSARWPQEKKLASLNPEFRVKVSLLLKALAGRGFQPTVFYGWRSVEVQKRLFQEGKSKVLFSFHNAQKPDGTPNAYAADIIDQRYAWTERPETRTFWTALGEEARKLGLIWGGDWTTFRDWAHVQYYPNSRLAQVKRESGL
jgi:peptidoglycan L-alanyl-D-glutamate endopeptidase CwlK